MISMAWHWVISWIIGWGGIGAVISAGLWALWFFCPAALLTYKTQLFHIAITATVVTLISTYFFTEGYNRGYAVMKSAVSKQNERAAKDADQADSDVANCINSGGDWNVGADPPCVH